MPALLSFEIWQKKKEKRKNKEKGTMEKTITFYFDKSSHIVSLHKHDRTCDNKLAQGLGESIGMFVTMLTNEIDRLPNDRTISITVKKEL